MSTRRRGGSDVPAMVGCGQAHENPQVDISEKLPYKADTEEERLPGAGM